MCQKKTKIKIFCIFIVQQERYNEKHYIFLISITFWLQSKEKNPFDVISRGFFVSIYVVC